MSEVVFNRTVHMTLWLAIADRLRVTGRFEATLGFMKENMISNLGLPWSINQCYACDYDDQFIGNCNHCPLKDFDCMALGDYREISYVASLQEHLNEDEMKKYYEMAIRIAMWPVKEGVVCR